MTKVRLKAGANLDRGAKICVPQMVMRSVRIWEKRLSAHIKANSRHCDRRWLSVANTRPRSSAHIGNMIRECVSARCQSEINVSGLIKMLR